MNKFVKLMTLAGVCGLLAVSVTGCTTAKAAEPAGPVRSIQVKTMEEQSKPITQHYIGVVDSKDQIEYSFKSSGRLGELYVEDGQVVQKGDLIAKLDIQDLNYQVDAAKATHSAAQLNITKAKEALDYDKNLLNSMKSLYEAGSVSQDKLDQITLKTEVSEASHNQALTQLNAAKADLNYKNGLLDDANVYAHADGTIVKTMYEIGELVPQGYPVVVQRSESQVLKVGIPQKNLNDIDAGSTVHITIDDQNTHGIVSRIDEAPDLTTRTYMAEIAVHEGDFHLGSIAEADIEVGQQHGIWIPIQSLLSEGEDFVYVTDGKRAFKRTVIPQDTSGMMVRVTGLEAGEQVVVSGMNNLSDGINIVIDESSN